MSRKVTLHDPELGALTDDRLTRDYRVFQREKGHRFSSDDMVTAYVAFAARPDARRVADLGCGLGSVLLHLAWKLPEARLWGIEAQDASFALLRRNVERNGLAERVRIHHGDLRDGALLAALGEGQFELVTGTPPYFPPDTALDADDPQRSYARIEYRGGVEAYLAAGVRLLRPDGTLVLCGDSGAEERVRRGAESVALHVRARHEVLPRAERPALFSVWTLTREAGACHEVQLTLRDAAGERTADAAALRAFSGFAPS